VLRLLKLTGIPARSVYCTLGFEQEYFVIDRLLYDLRPDLKLCGRTLLGAPSAKGQELQDHYFGSVKERVLAFMDEFERRALELGIPVKTRHNEVAPAQHEVAPVYERVSVAVDHNIILMELMRKVAAQQHLACLLHEKPFTGLNGSGKHANWSLATDTGINLLDPTDTPENNWHFLALLAAVQHAVYKHSALLRSSVGSASNDLRLGGHEAPPAIMSVYLGDVLDGLIDNIVKLGAHKSGKRHAPYDLAVPSIPAFPKDYSDRNRTSPFAFTGNKFEFRAVGGGSNPAFAITTLNCIVAESLAAILDDVEASAGKIPAKPTQAFLTEHLLPVLRKYFKQSQDIRFSGDNYSASWMKEAARRGLPNIQKSVYAFDELLTDRTAQAFSGVLTAEELKSRYEVVTETYGHHIHIEAKLLSELYSTQILPAALQYQKHLADSVCACTEALGRKGKFDQQKQRLSEVNALIEKSAKTCKLLDSTRLKVPGSTVKARARFFCEKVVPLCETLRQGCDDLEAVVDDSLWPLPKYREILFTL
jgi:glutamine synthetase